jgi:hypothetical protein
MSQNNCICPQERENVWVYLSQQLWERLQTRRSGVTVEQMNRTRLDSTKYVTFYFLGSGGGSIFPAGL